MARRFYFAYGSNMDEAQMASRCPDSTLIGRASLDGYDFLINDRGVASIDVAPKRVVHGLLWDISEEDEKRLDRYEGVAKGFYRKLTVSVKQNNGGLTEGLVYVASSNVRGTPRRGYMERIVRASTDHHFPADYIRELESWLLPAR